MGAGAGAQSRGWQLPPHVSPQQQVAGAAREESAAGMAVAITLASVRRRARARRSMAGAKLKGRKVKEETWAQG